MMRVAKAKHHIARVRELSSRIKATRLTKAKETAIIAKIRKDREAVWEAKGAARS